MSDVTEPTGGDAGQAESSAAEERITRAEAQAIANKAAASERRAAAEKLKDYESMRAKLADIENAQKTEIQKATERAAAAEARAESEAKGRQQDRIDAELRLQLQAQGYDPDLAVLVKSKATITSAEDVADAIKTALDGKAWARQAEPETPRPMGMPGAPTGPRPSSSWNAARLADVTARNMTKTMTDADWAEINAMTRAGTWR